MDNDLYPIPGLQYCFFSRMDNLYLCKYSETRKMLGLEGVADKAQAWNAGGNLK